MEAGDTGVGMGIYAGVLHALGLLAALADIANDPVGQPLASESLPQRVHLGRRRPASRDG